MDKTCCVIGCSTSLDWEGSGDEVKMVLLCAGFLADSLIFFFYGFNEKICLQQCDKRGMPDFVQLGGSEGLDLSTYSVIDSICGVDSLPGQ